MRWLLPEYVEDVLPGEAGRLELLRRKMLDAFAKHGYEFVIPPILEFIDSILTGSGGDLDLQTFRLMDQLSGRSMGARADMTPQVARIDAHLLNRLGVSRLCYCGSVLHAVPGGLFATREPIQVGAEIYGHEGLEADIEIIRLLAHTLEICGLSTSRLDLGHVGIFRAIVLAGGVDEPLARELFMALQAKDTESIANLANSMPSDVAEAFLLLPELYGGTEVIGLAREKLCFSGTAGTAIDRALNDLEKLAVALSELPFSFDLADLRGYDYHNGVAFAAYSSGCASAIARGGRYDNVSQAYGRARAATGFSLDMRELIRLVSMPDVHDAILAPWLDDRGLRVEIDRLRSQGERVMYALPGHDGQWREAGCDRKLTQKSGVWVIEVIGDA